MTPDHPRAARSAAVRTVAVGPFPAAIVPARRIPPESEKQFQAAVVRLARILGWRVYHAFDARRSAAGLPDLLMLRPPRMVVSELKRVSREPTVIQQAWLHDFKACGIEAYWWTPDCWGEIKRVLAA